MNHTRIVTLLVIGFISVVAWIAFNIHHASVTSTISEQIVIQTRPITPQFDTTTLNTLKTRQQITPFLDSTDSTISATVIEEVIITPDATSNATSQP